MLICFVYHFYYKTNKKKLIDSRSMNHAEKLEFDPSHDSAVRPNAAVSYKIAGRVMHICMFSGHAAQRKALH